jgi:DNA modification methylase
MTPYYDDGTCVIYHGDCRELLPRVSADVVLTDPPYGIGLDYGHADDWHPDSDIWRLVSARSIHMTTSNKHLPYWIDALRSAGWDYRHCSVYWNATRCGGNWNGQFAYAWEPVLSFAKPREPFRLRKRMLTDVIRHDGSRTVDHPAERDLGAWTAFLDLLPGDTTLDPFMGSGTTLRAAKDLGRKAIGIEIEERYCEIAAKRLGQEVLPLEAFS